jgi:hypothetical protein
MKKSTLISSCTLLMTCWFMGGNALVAQETAEETPPAEEMAINQGRAAVLLANSLGFYVSQDGPLTPVRAVELLMQNGISPLDGWKVNEMLTVDTMAIILGQALGLDENFTEEQKADPTGQPYKDALIAEFNLDLDQIVSGAIQVTSGPNPNDGAPGTVQPFPDDPDLLVSVNDFQQTLLFFAPSPGGTGGQVDSGSRDMTPSAP